MQTCICNDESKMKKITCLNCKVQWDVKMQSHERVSSCPLHRSGIAICSIPGYLCDECIAENYYIQPGWGFQIPKVMKKTLDKFEN